MEDLTLTEPEKMDLQKEASLPSLYCQGCRQCLGQCSAGLPIPDLMRAYMYVYDYRNLAHGPGPRGFPGSSSRVCGDCVQCPVKCSVGFNVRGKIRDVVRHPGQVPSEFIAIIGRMR